jgi:imidazole glycerol-phosphate synthase subunit HisH
LTVILDYGMGNLRSVERAFAAIGFPATVQPNLKGATRLVIPGVGAFGAAMENLLPVVDDLRKFAQDGNPVLGICLGQQLLFEWSEENPGTSKTARYEGLGLIPGGVRYFPSDLGLKVPHTGWNTVRFAPGSTLGGVQAEPYVYFVHSLYTECAEPDNAVGYADYGIEFAAAVQRDRVFGLQFHPEKSGPAGLRMLENFAAC